MHVWMALALWVGGTTAHAGTAETVAQLIRDEFSDARFEVVCLSEVDKNQDGGRLLVMTVDTKATKADPLRPADFQVNTWWIGKIESGKPSFLIGRPGNILQLIKSAVPTAGGDQKSFHTWLLQEKAPRSNPVNYGLWVLDQVVDENGKESVTGRLVNSPAAGRPDTGPVRVTCPVFQLK